MTMTQAEFIRKYNDENKIPFNDELFARDEDEIMVELMKVILSAQRNQIFTIKVDSFIITEDYDKINQILADYTNNTVKNMKKKEANEYEYVNLKDTYAKLLTVKYFIKVKNDSQMLDVHILVPKIIDKYYFKIAGNMWLAMLQIVDGSTYNNALTNNAKKHSITCKTAMPVRIYKNSCILTDINDKQFECVYYTSNIFKKTLPVFKYIFAKYGYIGTQQFTGVDVIFISSNPVHDETMYCVKIKDNIYINVPKYVFDNDYVTQSIFYTMHKAISEAKKITIAKIMTNDFWLESLGHEFKSTTAKKGLELLNSLEGIYDISTKEDIRLDEYTKRNIYSILLWIVREFSKLRNKDNLDVTLKRVRYGQYIASLYSMKLIAGLKRLSDIKNKVELKSIIRAIKTKPTYLLDEICKCNLVNYRNLVNDLDSLLAIKYSYKGVSGIGDKSNKSIPTIYRHVHPSQLGIMDTDSSPKSDPGISGVLCPMLKLYDSYFSDYEEPNYWEKEFKQTMDEYKAMTNKKEVLHFQKSIGIPVNEEELSLIEENLAISKNLIKPLIYTYEDSRLEKYTPILEIGGRIFFE